jgi:hypothetical protein
MIPNKAKALMMSLLLVGMLLVGVGSTTADAQGKRGAQAASDHCVP